MTRLERFIAWGNRHAPTIDAALHGAIALAVIGVFASFARLVYLLP